MASVAFVVVRKQAVSRLESSLKFRARVLSVLRRFEGDSEGGQTKS